MNSRKEASYLHPLDVASRRGPPERQIGFIGKLHNPKQSLYIIDQWRRRAAAQCPQTRGRRKARQSLCIIDQSANDAGEQLRSVPKLEASKNAGLRIRDAPQLLKFGKNPLPRRLQMF